MGISEKISPPADPDLLSRFFAEFLDEATFAEFRQIERQFGKLREQGSTVAGYPLIRPRDCAAITTLLATVFKLGKERFRTRDVALTERFEKLIAAFYEFCARVYPGEATAALILYCKVLLFMGEAQRVKELVTPLAMRPYAVENSLLHNSQLIELLAQAHARQGTMGTLPISFVAYGAWLAAQSGSVSLIQVASRFAPFVNLDSVDRSEPMGASWVRWASTAYLAAVRKRNGMLRTALYFIAAHLCLVALTTCYRWLSRSQRRGAPFSFARDSDGPILVTRAMGGIGDLLMMQPGLEALSRKSKKPIDFAIPRKFFPIFANDPNVRLVDIDGPIIDASRYSAFVNLSLCPAGRYESSRRPHVKRGRVELFARAMGIKPADLKAQGWHINRPTSQEEKDFAERFLREKGLGIRPLVGIQPYSRDSYKDHPRIEQIIEALAQDHDILFFHHLTDGLPSGPGFADTAGVPLGNSLALVSRLDAMVCVDSAFLHAAAAYDIPVIAMFGPTDARTFTRHHRNATILWKPQTFGCVPCWRNEDLPCHVTGAVSTSPCIAAITAEEVRTALRDALGSRQTAQ